jgi:hypothetical protein
MLVVLPILFGDVVAEDETSSISSPTALPPLLLLMLLLLLTASIVVDSAGPSVRFGIGRDATATVALDVLASVLASLCVSSSPPLLFFTCSSYAARNSS